MQKSSLNLYLQKLAAGDFSFAEKLCDQLAERLIYAPLVPSPAEQESGTQLKVNVMRIAEAHRSIVYIFTSEDKFKSWAEQTGYIGGSISLLGADFCAALGDRTWLLVDPGTLSSIELQPGLVARIAAADTINSASVNPVPQEVDSAPRTDRVSVAPAAKSSEKTSTGLVRQALFAEVPLPEQYASPGEKAPQGKRESELVSEPAQTSSARLASAAVFADKKTQEPIQRLSLQMTSGKADQGQQQPLMDSAATLANTSTSLPRPVIFSSAEKKPLPLPPDKPKNQPGKAGKSFLRFLKGK